MEPTCDNPPNGEIVRRGYLKKLKTMKKKFFVLMSGSPEKSARLEYFDSEKKWKSGCQPKKEISLKSCFNITRRLDTRHKHVIALYTKEECLSLVLETEEDLALWLQALLSLLHGDSVVDDQPHAQQHVWQVNVQKKGLGASRNILGLYHLCLTDKKLFLVKIRSNNSAYVPDVRLADTLEFSLSSIRRCGDSECFFYMEVGRSSMTGAGELWMHTEDPNIAQSMHYTILNAMSTRSSSIKEELGPKTRNRSSSANEASKPIFVLARRQTHTGTKSHGLSPSSESTECGGRSCVGLCISPCVTASAAYCASQDMDLTLKEQNKITQEDSCNSVVDNTVGSINNIVGVRERCDSLPSRGNTVISTPRTNVSVGVNRYPTALRPHSMFVHGIGQSPPMMTNSPLSPNSGACSTDSAGSSMSIDETDNLFHHSTTPDEMSHLVGMIPEEVVDEMHGIWQPEKNETKDDYNAEIGIKKGHMKTILTVDSFDSSSPVPIMCTPTLGGDYMPMSPANLDSSKLADLHSVSHSRTSSVTEEMSNLIDKVPSADVDDGYVDMEPSKKIVDHAMSPTGSFCSVTSSTPSNDLRFSEFHLEKVSSYFPPNEDKENRPARAYSVGSRPDHITKIISRPETMSNAVTATEAARTRAFSVGSRSKGQKDNRILNHGTPPHCHLHHLNSTSHSANKSSSAPLLAGAPYGNSSSYLYNSNHSSVEPLDMMEMDFSSNRTTSTSSIKPSYGMDIKIQNTCAKSPSGLPVSKSNTQFMSKNAVEGYMDMSPVGLSKAGYVEMKPVEHLISNAAQQKVLRDSKKASFSKSPPTSNVANLSKPIKVGSEGYVEMTWNNLKSMGKQQSHGRMSSLPITINSNNSKDSTESNSVVSSSTSPNFNSSHLKKHNENDSEENYSKGNTPKSSPGVSPMIPVIPSPLSSLKRHSKKHQMRRNSKELSSSIIARSPTFPFDITSPVSPVKPIMQPVTSNAGELLDKKSSANPSCSSGKVDHDGLVKMLSECSFIDEPVSDYMEMNPRSLTTVKEINESNLNKIGVDKDTKQLINNATKVFDSGSTPVDFSEYISLNPNAKILKWQKSADDSVSNDSLYNTSSSKSINLQSSKPITTEPQNIIRKISVPTYPSNYTFESIDTNIKVHQSLLSSHPLANKNIMPNPLVRSNVIISNNNQVQTVRKPKLVTITSQTQPITANFKPITSSEFCEPRSTKSNSPKPVESVFNRQLMNALSDFKSVKSESSNSNLKNDGYEILIAQNGKNTQSRPNSVNKSKKGNGCSNNSRPPSVASQGDVSGGNGSRSRPSSVSSELSNTPTNSRPASVTGEREGSSRGLHYASLQLDNVLDRCPRPPPTPIANRQTFSYAQIDFVKSEELKNSKNVISKTKN